MRNLIVLIKCILCVTQCLSIPLQSICQNFGQNFIDTTSKLIGWVLVSLTGKIFYRQIRNLGFEPSLHHKINWCYLYKKKRKEELIGLKPFTPSAPALTTRDRCQRSG